MIAIGSELQSYSVIKNRISSKEEMSEEEKKILNQIKKLIILLKDALESSKDFSDSAYNLFDEVFELRLEGINWLLKEKQLKQTIKDSTGGLFYHFEKTIKENHALSQKSKFDKIESIQTLSPNLAFAKRTLKRVVESYFKNEEGKAFLTEKSIPLTSYNDYIKTIRLSLPTETKNQILELLGSSLMLETCLISIDILLDEYHSIQLPKNRINELNQLIVSNAQQYGAMAKRMGFLGKKRNNNSKVIPNLSQEELYDEKKLAETGLNNY